jgi:site-specific DNA recombinase
MTIAIHRPTRDPDSPATPKVNFAFYGRVATDDSHGTASSRGWQFARANALIASCGGRIVTEYIDSGPGGSQPWRRRPAATALLETPPNRRRGFPAVVLGAPDRALHRSPSATLAEFSDYGVQLWLPEIGGPFDPANQAHALTMALLFGGTGPGRADSPAVGHLRRRPRRAVPTRGTARTANPEGTTDQP